MASVPNGGLPVPGNLNVMGDSDLNGDLNVDGAATVVGAASAASAAISGAITAASLTADYVKLTPRADPPSVEEEGVMYMDTDHKLYVHNGTTWKEVTFA